MEGKHSRCWPRCYYILELPKYRHRANPCQGGTHHTEVKREGGKKKWTELTKNAHAKQFLSRSRGRTDGLRGKRAKTGKQGINTARVKGLIPSGVAGAGSVY